MKEQIQNSAEDLANMCLEDASNYKGFDDVDLTNATLIFSNILMDVIYTTNQGLSLEKQLELAETTGKMIRELILSTTDKDMREVVKKSFKV